MIGLLKFTEACPSWPVYRPATQYAIVAPSMLTDLSPVVLAAISFDPAKGLWILLNHPLVYFQQVILCFLGVASFGAFIWWLFVERDYVRPSETWTSIKVDLRKTLTWITKRRLLGLLGLLLFFCTATLLFPPELDSRRIIGRDRVIALRWLSENPGKARLAVKVGDDEAAMLARDLYDVLTEAGWDLGGEPIRGVVVTPGPMQPGLTITLRGQPIAPGESIAALNPPGYSLGKALDACRLEVVAQQQPDLPDGILFIQVGPNPHD